jgi:hypothetical protein
MAPVPSCITLHLIASAHSVDIIRYPRFTSVTSPIESELSENVYRPFMRQLFWTPLLVSLLIVRELTFRSLQGTVPSPGTVAAEGKPIQLFFVEEPLLDS